MELVDQSVQGPVTLRIYLLRFLKHKYKKQKSQLLLLDSQMFAIDCCSGCSWGGTIKRRSTKSTNWPCHFVGLEEVVIECIVFKLPFGTLKRKVVITIKEYKLFSDIEVLMYLDAISFPCCLRSESSTNFKMFQNFNPIGKQKLVFFYSKLIRKCFW